MIIRPRRPLTLHTEKLTKNNPSSCTPHKKVVPLRHFDRVTEIYKPV